MDPQPSIRTVARTAVVATWLFVLALAGRPVWAAVLLGAVLVLVWASPYLLAAPGDRRRPRAWPGATRVQLPRPS